MSFALANDLERLVGQLVAAAGLRPGQRRTSQPDRQIELALAERHSGGQNLKLVTDRVFGRGEAAGVIKLIPSSRPVSGHDGGPSQPHVSLRLPPRRGTQGGQLLQQPLADLTHPFGVAGSGQHLAEGLVNLDRDLEVVVDQLSRSPQRCFGGGQRAAIKCSSPRFKA